MPFDFVPGMTDWLLDGRRTGEGPADLLAGFAEMLCKAGLPLDRVTTHAPTLHPDYRWVMRVWSPGAPVEELLRRHGIEATPTFHGNTVEHVVATGDWLDLRLDRGEGQDYPVTRSLACEGVTHYMMAPLVFGDGSKGATSWSTCRSGGFTAAQVAAIRALASPFTLAFEARELRQGLERLLGSYVGTDPARRILAGTVQRGDVCRINAAIMLTDMRGYTRLSEYLDERELVEQLNAHFDCIVPAVHEAGGEILKFTGDGVLAVFDAARIDGAPNRAALQAARATIAALDSRNASTQRRPIRMGIALHVGEVAYGNIGSGDRLDFTAIGRDVNLTSRLERLCKSLNRSPLMTKSFVEGLGEPVVSLGHHRFRSFSGLQTIYGLPDGVSSEQDMDKSAWRRGFRHAPDDDERDLQALLAALSEPIASFNLFDRGSALACAGPTPHLAIKEQRP